MKPAAWLVLVALAAGCHHRTPPPPVLASPHDANTMRRLLAILDYVASDYRGAVTAPGQITTRSEYDEQRAFMRDAAALAEKVPPGRVSPQGLVRALSAKVDAIAGPDDIADAARATRRTLMDAYGVILAPSGAPSEQRGQELYAVNCAVCHGDHGGGDGLRAAKLDPHPRSFLDPEAIREISPARAFNGLTDGVKGTAMPSFQALPAGDRWSLAFYVFGMRHDDAAAQRGEAVWQQSGSQIAATASRLAGLSDADLARELGKLSAADRADAVAFLRKIAPFREQHHGAPLAETRAMVAAAMDAMRAGDRPGAQQLLGTAYLEGFEPHEASLRSRDADLVTSIEEAFLALRTRAGAATVPPERVEADALRLGALLDRAEERLTGDRGFRVAFVGALVIVMREGIEAALLLMLMLGFARRRESEVGAGAGRVARSVHAGWLAALVAGGLTWWVSGNLIHLGGRHRELTEGVIGLAAAIFMFSASHFVLAKLDAKRRVDSLKKHFGGSSRRFGLAALAFVVVYREAFEVVLFLRAIALDSGGAGSAVALGAGTAGVLLIGFVWAMGRFGRRLRPAPLLASAGLILCVLAVVFAGKGVRSLQEAGVVAITPLGDLRLDWLGLYPTVQTVVAQAAFVVLLLGSLGWALRHRLSRPDVTPAPTRPA